VAAGQRFADLLRLLDSHGVEIVVVGAAAAVLEGVPMTTFDLDVVFEPGEANRVRLLARSKIWTRCTGNRPGAASPRTPSACRRSSSTSSRRDSGGSTS
jgi:hypothetical protein